MMFLKSQKKGIQFLPAPTNPVGFTRFKLIDANRIDEKGRHRQVEVLLWYPRSLSNHGKRKSYLSGHSLRNLPLLNLRFGKNFVKNFISQILTNSYEGAPVSDARDRYPVLIFSHDLGMIPEYYTSLMEHLSGEGYFVFGINHHKISEHSTLDTPCKKNSIYVNPLLLCRWKMKLASLSRNLVGKSYDEKWAYSKKIYSASIPFRNHYAEMTADRTFLINFLEAVNKMMHSNEPPYNLLANRLNMSALGVIGHGWGGSSSIDSLVNDQRVKAAINLNGIQISNAVHSIIAKPMLMIYSQQHTGINEGVYFNSGEIDCHTIEGTSHKSFTDWSFFKHQGENALYSTASLAVNFFDRYLKRVDHLAHLRTRTIL
jgi:hypothetical protein